MTDRPKARGLWNLLWLAPVCALVGIGSGFMDAKLMELDVSPQGNPDPFQNSPQFG